MRDLRRPPPILLPATETSVSCNHHDINTALIPSTSNSSVGSAGFGRLAIDSPYTPGPTTAIHIGLTPRAAFSFGRGLVPKHRPTAWDGPFCFFEHFPQEIRDKIYEFLIGNLGVIINTSKRVPIEVFHVHGHSSALYNSLISFRRPPTYRRTHSWLSQLSKQFFNEVRLVAWRSAKVKFERRWDFINAIVTGGFYASQGTLFPTQSAIFNHLQELHLNLDSTDDFGRAVTIEETQRVMTTMLNAIRYQMPLLRRLRLQVDEKRTHISSTGVIFLPEQWFLRALLRIGQLQSVHFLPGPELEQRSRQKAILRGCLHALSLVLDAHFANYLAFSPINPAMTGRELQARVLRHMMALCSRIPWLQDAHQAMTLKLVLLESNIG